MSELRLYALGIDEVRDIFGADAALAQQLRDAAQRRWFDDAPQRQRGMLHLLGPLTRKPIAPPDPNRPTPSDAEAILGGRYVTPDRTLAAWRLLESWLVERAWGQLTLPLSEQELDQLDFDIVAAGVPSELSVVKLFRRDAGIPLRPLPGMRAGYAKHPQVLAMDDALTRVSSDVEPRSAEQAGRLDRWLDGFAGWGEQALAQGRPTPDLVGIWLA